VLSRTFWQDDVKITLQVNKYCGDTWYLVLDDGEGEMVVSFFEDDLKEFVKWLKKAMEELEEEWDREFDRRRKKWRNLKS